MNWHRHPALLDRLAAEYALGTLAGGARRRFEKSMRERPEVARAAARWAERLAGMDARLAPRPATAALWQRIEAQAFDGGRRSQGRAAMPPRTLQGGAQSVLGWRRWFAPGAALAFGIALGIGVPLVQRTLRPDAISATQLPESYVGVLATAAGKPGLIVSSLRRGLVVDLKVVQRAPVEAGRVLWLWTLDAQGAAQPVAALPGSIAEAGTNFISIGLGRPAEDLFARAVELAVSAEPAGATPAAPSDAFVYRGLCGRLWPVKPAASASR